jgi:hypothetical protein
LFSVAKGGIESSDVRNRRLTAARLKCVSHLVDGGASDSIVGLKGRKADFTA